MNKGALLLLALAPAFGCRERAAESGRTTASPYSAQPDSTPGQGRIEGTHTGLKLEAPQLIPGVEAQLQQVLRDKGHPDAANLSAYRGGASALVDAMEADVRRAGLSDTGSFSRLTDSIVRDLGGGAGGLAKGPAPDELPTHADRMRRLIASYQSLIRSTGR